MDTKIKKVLKRFKIKPHFAIITGSGIKLFQDYKVVFETTQLNAAHSTQHVKGHAHSTKIYKVKNKHVLVFSGRHHLYEGLGIAEVVKNVRLAHKLGVKKILITNAAGGINNKFKAGDLMLITGFMNLMQPSKRGLLSLITKKPSIIKTKLTNTIKRFNVRKGVYAGMLGPSYETFSEIKLLQLIGADAVGMSTIPEMICAKNLGMDYTGISVISNVWNKSHKPSHEEVLHNVQRANEKLNELILKLL